MNLARPRGSIPPPVAPPGCGSALRRDTGHSTRIGPAGAGSWRPCTFVAPQRTTHNAAFRTQVHNAGSQCIAANCKTPQNTLETRGRNVQRRNGVVTTRVVTKRPWLWQRSLHNATHNAGITRGIALQLLVATQSRNATEPGGRQRGVAKTRVASGLRQRGGATTRDVGCDNAVAKPLSHEQ